MVGTGDRDQRGGPLAERATAQLGDAELGDDLVNGVLAGGETSPVASCNDTRVVT
jgi:hypothetical protein